MAKDTEKLIRQLSLISFLMAQGRPVSALEIKREVEGYSDMNDDAFARRFYADRAELESLGIQLGVEEVPLLPDTWDTDSVPLASYVAPAQGQPGRVVLLRRPIEHRAETRADLEALLLTVLVEQVAEVLGLPPEDVHPDYEAE